MSPTPHGQVGLTETGRASLVSAECPAAISESACAVCGSHIRGRVRVRLGVAQLVACLSCASWTYFPRLSSEDQAALHDVPDYFEHPYFQSRRDDRLRARFRCRKAFEFIGSAVPPSRLRGARLLDIGCDTGLFLDVAAEQIGILPMGIDVSSRGVAETISRGIPADRTAIEFAPASISDVDVVTALDLIEHVSDPGQFLLGVRDRLKPNGLVYIETPNICSNVYQVGALLCLLTGCRPRSMFTRLFPPQHAQYFTTGSLAALARQCGFEVVRIGARLLPNSDLAASWWVRVAMTGLQLLDRVLDKPILLCALLRKTVRLEPMR